MELCRVIVRKRTRMSHEQDILERRQLFQNVGVMPPDTDRRDSDF
jgi:hypothetical protein